MLKPKFQRIFSYVVFGLYFLLLTWLVLFKLNFNILEVSHARTVNLIPFWYDTESEFLLHLKEMLYNVLVFVPLGMYVSIFRPDWAFWKKALPCFAVSLLFETLQFAFALGVSDVTDLITNTLGGVAGVLLYTLLRRLFREHSISIINCLGFATEGLAVFFLAVLLVANG